MIPDQEKSDQYKCPLCGPIKECTLDQVPSISSYIISFLSMFIFGIWSIFIIPLIFQSTKVMIKRCFYCNTEIERQKFFSIPSLSDKVLQFKFGHCMIVLSRKYAVILLFIFIILFGYFEFTQVKQQEILDKKKHIENTWEQYVQQCGKYEIIDNGMRAKMVFSKEYEGKIITWKGYFESIKKNSDQQLSYSEFLFVKMDPTESQNELPDIAIGVSYLQQKDIAQQFDKTPRGQEILFTAEFFQLGSEFNFHLLSLISLTKTDNVKVLSEIQKYQSLPQ